MFGFRLWGDFAVFREPLAITQNITFMVPPKTTIGGMLAAILGIDYNDYFNDKDFFDFKYSLVLDREIRKKSFAQNYIDDYTKKSAVKLDIIKKIKTDTKKLSAELKENYGKEIELLNKSNITSTEKKELKKIRKRMKNLQLVAQFTKPKPIFRELLIKPEYLIFIDNFKYEDKIIEYLKNHYSAYNLYLGNTEFPANFENVVCTSKPDKIKYLDSFTGQQENVIFEVGKKYTNIYAATKTINSRKYIDYRNIIFSTNQIVLRKKINGYIITANNREYYCDFI